MCGFGFRIDLKHVYVTLLILLFSWCS